MQKLKSRGLAVALLWSLGLSCYAFAESPEAQTGTQTAREKTQSCFVEGLAEKLQCGHLSVPLDYTQATSAAKIDIHYTILPAIKNLHPEKAMVAIAGGPGQSAIEHAASFQQLLRAVRQFQDVILIDQRGTGKSSPLQCQALTTEQAMIFDESLQDIQAMTRDCLAEQTVDIAQFGSLNAVEDLERIRQHLGYQQLDLYGVSYGTRMAQLYTRQYPEQVATMTLDGVVPMQLDLGQISLAVADAVAQLFADCRQQSACQQAFPELQQTYQQLEQQLAKQAISTQVIDPLTGQASRFLFTRDKLLSTVRMGLYSPKTRRLLPYAIMQASQQQYQPLLGLFALAQGGGDMAMGMHASVICGEDVPFMQAPDPKAGYLGQQMYQGLQEICQVWQVPAVDTDFHQPLTSETPSLLFSGGLDPATPVAWGELAMAELTQAKHLVAPHATHGVLAQTCAPKLLAQFVKQGHWQQLDTHCIERGSPQLFYLNANTVSAVVTHKELEQ